MEKPPTFLMTMSLEEPSKRKPIHKVLGVIIILAVTFGSLGLHGTAAQALDDENITLPERLAQAVQELAQGEEETAHDYATDPRVLAVHAFFAEHNMPAADYAEAFVRAADENDFEHWALIAAIARWETSGGKYMNNPQNTRLNNYVGYGPKHYSFPTVEAGIEYVTSVLAGNVERMAHYYADKDLKGILKSYNSVRHGYYEKITSAMGEITTLADQIALAQAQTETKLAMN